MTSRVSFHKLLIETLRRHLAAVLITVLAFFVHIISFFLNVQSILNMKIIEDAANSHFPATRGYEYAMERFVELCSPNMWNAILAMLIGVYLAFDFFRYLHSKKETDFYESLPIRKQTRFKLLLVAGVGVFTVFATITIVLELAIVYGLGYGSVLILQNMLWCLVCMIGIFLSCFAITVLAMVMTGHSIVAFLGLGAFVSYIPLIIGNLIPLYATTFLDTYVYRDINPKYYYFSPVTLAYKASYNWELWNIGEHWTYLLGCFIFSLVVGFIAYILFTRRPSEAAGRAMAFEKINAVIRILIVIPLALYAGLLLNELAAFASTAWLIFGVVFAGFLIHGMIECIFQFDIRALVSKKRQLFFTILFCLGFVFIFWADVFQYDKYIPEAKDVKSIKIDTYLFGDNGDSWESYKDQLTGESIELALDAIKDIRKSADPSENSDYTYMNDFTVTYELKTGMKKQRQYSFYGNKFPESLDKLSATEDFKDDFCILYHLDELEITSLSVSNGPEQFKLNMTKEHMKELCEVYLKEYGELTFSDSLSKPAVFDFIVEYPVEGKAYTLSDTYTVFSDFTNTISYLNKYNVVSFVDSQNIQMENLEIYSDKYEYEGQQYITDKEQLNELKQYMILGDFMYYHFDYSDNYVCCNLRYVFNGSTRYMDVYLKPSDISKVLNN